MKKIKYFLFSIICLFSCSIVFAENEVVVKSVTPIYDEASTIIVTEEENSHSVVFNDKEQSIEYKIVLENTTDKDLPVESVELSTPSEDFLVYELKGLDSDDVIEANSTKEIVISLETIKKDGWGRNFNDELFATVNFEKVNLSLPDQIIDNITNPNTTDLIILIIGAVCITGLGVSLIKRNKFSRYIILVITITSILPIAKAQDTIKIDLNINAIFESQNVMKSNSCVWTYDDWMNEILVDCGDYWDYSAKIKNFYIENEFRDITNYEFKFDVSEEKNERVIAYLVKNEDDNYYDLYLQADGIIYPNSNARYYFANMSSLNNIYYIDGLDTSNVTDMSYMFYYTGASSTEFTLDLSNFDTSSVTNMSNMFRRTGQNSKNITLDLSNFDTSNVTDMSYMFSMTAFENKEFTLDLSDFDTSSVTNMSYMFDYTGYNSTKFTLDLSNFDTSNVTDMSHMFESAGHSSENFSLDISNFDTSSVTNMGYMFHYIGLNNKSFTLDVSSFDTRNVTNMSMMFGSVGYFNENFTLDLSNFDTSNVTNMSYMFDYTGYNSTKLTLDLSNFDTSSVTNMFRMFYYTGYNSEEITLDVSSFNTGNVTNMASMFNHTGYNSANFTLDVSNFDTSNVTNMANMFDYTGYNSANLNTSITIRDTKITSSNGYNSMFRGVATKPGSKITVNYTSETSDLVDNMIATKSADSNVVKGVQVD